MSSKWLRVREGQVLVRSRGLTTSVWDEVRIRLAMRKD
jgi:hypothetical protein